MNDRRRYRLVATTRTGSVRTVYRTRHGYSLRARKHYSAWMTAGEIEAARRWAKHRRHVRDTHIIHPERWTHLRLATGTRWPTDRDLLRRLNAIGNRMHRVILIKSGRRLLGRPGDYPSNPGTQWFFWEAAQAGAGNTAAYPNPSAPHVAGVAADCGVIDRRGRYTSIGDNRRARRLMHRLGLCLPVGPSSINPAGEAWHVQTLATGGACRA